MKHALVLSCTPNGMPARVVDPNLRPGDVDINRTFNAMRETQRKQQEHVRYMNSFAAHAKCAVNMGLYNMATQQQYSQGLGLLASIFGSCAKGVTGEGR